MASLLLTELLRNAKYGAGNLENSSAVSGKDDTYNMT
jgi:hypothetical protein